MCRRSCIGETCHSNLDCGPSYEYCISSKICWASGLHCSKDAHCKGDGSVVKVANVLLSAPGCALRVMTAS